MGWIQFICRADVSIGLRRISPQGARSKNQGGTYLDLRVDYTCFTF